MSFIHGHSATGRYGCGERHDSIMEARCCDAGILTPDAIVVACSWAVQHIVEGEPYIVDCEAPSVETERGFRCIAGHSHVHAQFCAQEGWDYADGPFEAKDMMKAGVFPMAMDGSGPAEIAP